MLSRTGKLGCRKLKGSASLNGYSIGVIEKNNTHTSLILSEDLHKQNIQMYIIMKLCLFPIQEDNSTGYKRIPNDEIYK